jgi:hypothetical protein
MRIDKGWKLVVDDIKAMQAPQATYYWCALRYSIASSSLAGTVFKVKCEEVNQPWH